MGVKPNYSELPDDLKKKIDGWQKNSNPSKQLQALEDIADMSQEMLNSYEKGEKREDERTRELGAVLLDIRESLEILETKEQPKMVDSSAKVVKSVDELKTALTKKLDKQPKIEPIVNVAAPVVNAKTPKVDVSGITKAVDKIPAAFDKAIKKMPKVEIPATDLKPLQDRFDAMLESLASIDTATRMKPQAPKSMKVTTDSAIDVQTLPYDTLIVQNSGNVNILYIGKADPGSSKASAVWQIKEVDETSGVEFIFADGDANFDNIWNDRESLSY